jgi:hypothetical protein
MSALLRECLFGNCTLGETDKLVKINHGYDWPPNCYLALNQARIIRARMLPDYPLWLAAIDRAALNGCKEMKRMR